MEGTLGARKEKSLYCTLVLPRNSSTFLHVTFPGIKIRLSRAQDTCRSLESRSQTLRSYWSAPRRRPLGKGNAGSRNVLSPPGSASVSFFVDVICLKNKLSLKINYHKIPKISPSAYIFQRPFLRGLFLKGLIFGGAYLEGLNGVVVFTVIG